MSPLGYLQLFVLAVLVTLGGVAYFVVSGMSYELGQKATTISELNRKVEKLEAKALAEAGRIDRRDKAIAQSKCAETIQDWIKHPEKIPEPFDPFNRENGGNRR